MKTFRNVSLAAAAVFALSACASGPFYTPEELDKAKKVTPTGSAFNKALYKDYLDLSVFEKGQEDLTSIGVFAHRAIVAGSGKSILPEEIAKRELPADKVGELTNARKRLIAALDGGGRAKTPDSAALAQAKFDCWMEQQEENNQPDHIAACRLGFEAAMKKMGAAPPKSVAKKPVLGPYIVYFAFDSSLLDVKAMAVIKKAANEATSAKVTGAILDGHTDRAGASAYNMKLSKARVDAVGAALVNAGISSGMAIKSHLGENISAVQTEDGKQEAKNRRVEIKFER